MHSATDSDFDVMIVGGGAIGTTLALALADHPLRIALVESQDKAVEDKRALALSHASINIFNALGILAMMTADITPIKAIEVSEAKGFGLARFYAENYGLSELGQIMEAGKLVQALRQQLSQKNTVSYFCPATVKRVKPAKGGYRIFITQDETQKEYSCRLLVAADGTDSSIRQLLQIRTTAFPKESALITRIQLARSHKNVAYERFTKQGAIAALPLENQQCAIVWPVDASFAAPLLDYSQTQFLQAIQSILGYRLGRIVHADPAKVFTFTQIHAHEQIRAGLVLLGNAAHTLHPIAAQGLNLGLRDMACLAETIIAAVAQGQNPGSLQVLHAYQQQRRQDQAITNSFTRGIKSIFTQDLLPVNVLRNMGLTGINVCSPIKDLFAKQAMGLVKPAASLLCN